MSSDVGEGHGARTVGHSLQISNQGHAQTYLFHPTWYGFLIIEKANFCVGHATTVGVFGTRRNIGDVALLPESI